MFQITLIAPLAAGNMRFMLSGDPKCKLKKNGNYHTIQVRNEFYILNTLLEIIYNLSYMSDIKSLLFINQVTSHQNNVKHEHLTSWLFKFGLQKLRGFHRIFLSDRNRGSSKGSHFISLADMFQLIFFFQIGFIRLRPCLLYTSPSPRDRG